jgi:5-methylcytosine-specific restriction endonuclease McrA
MKAIHIQAICAKRYQKRRRDRRGSLTPSVRREIWAKTGGTCHVCGGRAGKRWQADHVVPWQLGGGRTADNYLPICRECNGLRWNHEPRVLRLNHEDGCVCEERHQAQHNTRQGNDSRTSAPNGD